MSPDFTEEKAFNHLQLVQKKNSCPTHFPLSSVPKETKQSFSLTPARRHGQSFHAIYPDVSTLEELEAPIMSATDWICPQ
jgi:hypothetical protein